MDILYPACARIEPDPSGRSGFKYLDFIQRIKGDVAGDFAHTDCLFLDIETSANLSQKRALVGLLCAMAVFAIPTAHLVSQRIGYTADRNSGDFRRQHEFVSGTTPCLWQAAYSILLEHPWTGVGPGNIAAAMAGKTYVLNGTALNYTHFHNMFATAAVRGGIPGILALAGLYLVPMFVAAKASKTKGREAKVYFTFLVALQIAFLLSGLTGLALGHDIFDTLFIAGTVFALYGVYSAKENADETT